ncbi:MAG: dephospho-CoA kinase [Sphaerochaeta sp.]|jgi:dephospho-CoA kinase
MVVIGLTGKVCAGKDEYARAFGERGALVIDMDKLGHQVLEEQHKAISETFGASLVVDGKVDRGALGAQVFSDQAKLRALEEILHPAMVERTKAIISEAKEETVVINAALLKRMGLVELCDRVVFIAAPLWLRYLRCYKRQNLSIQSFCKRNRAQKDINPSVFGGNVQLTVFHNRHTTAIIHRQVASYCDTMDADVSTKR